MAQKTRLTLDGIELAGQSATAWQFTTGTQPYRGVFHVHKSKWSQIERLLGKSSTLFVTDARGTSLAIRDVYPLEQLPSESPNRVYFTIADQRWKWPYRMLSRDYNIPKKTGDLSPIGEGAKLPFGGFVTEDQYDYKGFSLSDGEAVWTAQEALEDALDVVTDFGKFDIADFPLNESARGGVRDFTLQNVIVRDPGDVAVARILAYIPGATLWVTPAGVVKIINAAKLDAAEGYLRNLPGVTWDGETAVVVKRKAIRPGTVVVHYQREVELLMEYEDDYSQSLQLDPARPYIENVIPTVDEKTTVTEYDPVLRREIEKKDLPPGTYVSFKAWLEAMDEDKPEGSDPWTFNTIKLHWLHGDLDGALGARGKDLDEDANIAMRVQAIKQHFRQTFRLNRLYVDRMKDLLDVRVAMLDPVTGFRAPAAVWGQACIVPSKKGEMMTERKNPQAAQYYRNVDYLKPSEDEGRQIITTAPGPTRLVFADRDLGIFRLEWILSPFGTEQAFVPCHLVGEDSNDPKSPSADMTQQDSLPIAPGVKTEGKTNGIFLAPTLKFKALVTFIPGAPNNKFVYHREEIDAEEVQSIVKGDWRIQAGNGPDLEVFVQPGEASARFAWRRDTEAGKTIGKLLGVDRPNQSPVEAGIEDRELPGFLLINEQRELWSHARSTAAEMFSKFADSVQGRVTTPLPVNGIDVVGNMSGAAVVVAGAPSAKTIAIHNFPGIPRTLSRFAVMNESARQVVLGIVRFR